MNVRVLGIETSCDETGVALYHSEQGILANVLHTQSHIHKEYGGVVPELASRDHIAKLLPLIEQCLQQARCSVQQLDAIAYTAGPGLIGALLVGATMAQTMGWATGLPVIAVHHMEGHLLSPLMEQDGPEFPFIALLVSGGHTQLVQVVALGEYQLLGDTLDDAVGEAFDKTAKLFGLPYPGGPELAALAEKGRPDRFQFPRPMLNRPGMDFSFSGLKTHVIQSYRKQPRQDDQLRADMALEFQRAVVDVLIEKSVRALQAVGMQRLVVSGGVSANRELRQRLQAVAQEKGFKVYFPRPEFSTDNGAMIAYAGMRRYQEGKILADVDVRPRWSLTELAG